MLKWITAPKTVLLIKSNSTSMTLSRNQCISFMENDLRKEGKIAGFRFGSHYENEKVVYNGPYSIFYYRRQDDGTWSENIREYLAANEWPDPIRLDLQGEISPDQYDSIEII